MQIMPHKVYILNLGLYKEMNFEQFLNEENPYVIFNDYNALTLTKE